MDYRVSVVQFKPDFFAVTENLNKLITMLLEMETDLVVLPELCLSGYVFQKQEEVEKVSETIPEGFVFQEFCQLSTEKGFSIVYGFAEKAENRYYNSAALINPDGSYYIYRKTHLFYREKLFFTPGDTGFQVFSAKGNILIGIMICFDWQFPESARTLALKGAQIICHPSNLVLPWCQQAMKTRSLENRVFSITSNRVGIEYNNGETMEFTGKSQILGTKGEVLLQLDEKNEGMGTIIIDPNLALDKSVNPLNDVFKDRRREMYEL